MMIETVVLFGHLAIAGLIIALVLLQRGKGAEAGTGFGAGASGTVFGARGSSNFFSRSTAVLAFLFFATSLTLAYFATRTTGSDSLLEGSILENATLEQGSSPGLRANPADPVPAIELDEDGELPAGFPAESPETE
jgi:preprotein translocase subunit SecG